MWDRNKTITWFSILFNVVPNGNQRVVEQLALAVKIEAKMSTAVINAFRQTIFRACLGRLVALSWHRQGHY